MSINSESPRLNEAGQVVQGTIASFVTNGIIHPIGTIKNLQMVGSLRSLKDLTSVRGLYNGYLAICGVDAVTFSIAYLTNDRLSDRDSALWSSVVSGLIVSPVVAVGEGLMANRQVNAMPYLQVFRRAFRLNGIILTAFREVPFIAAVFYASPILNRYFQALSPTNLDLSIGNLGIQIASGGISGAGAGLVTAPVDLIKTRVQTSGQPLSILNAIRLTVANDGWSGLLRGGRARAFYIALAVASMNVLNNMVSACLPDVFHAKN